MRSVRAQFRRGPCSDERPSLKGFAPFEAAQLDWSEARVTDQAQREVRSRGYPNYSSREMQPRSECASLAADRLPLAKVILRIDIRVENGGLHRRS